MKKRKDLYRKHRRINKIITQQYQRYLDLLDELRHIVELKPPVKDHEAVYCVSRKTTEQLKNFLFPSTPGNGFRAYIVPGIGYFTSEETDPKKQAKNY